MNSPVQQGKVQSQLHGVSKHRYQRQKKANAQLDNQIGNGTFGHKTVKQNNHKVITVGQSPATWDSDTPTQSTTNDRKR